VATLRDDTVFIGDSFDTGAGAGVDERTSMAIAMLLETANAIRAHTKRRNMEDPPEKGDMEKGTQEERTTRSRLFPNKERKQTIEPRWSLTLVCTELGEEQQHGP